MYPDPTSHEDNGGGGALREHAPAHYYGDIVRRLFVASGILILIGMPFFADYLPYMASVSAIAAILIAITAGTANPRSRGVQILLLAVSALGVLFFESYAAYSYRYFSLSGRGILFFLLMQVLAVLFFFALYFSTKTIRWMVRKKGE
ncbi:MAG: hypothetical protein A2847_00645 [Candidatus Sungbacteria bacterium RIFCSPHIGHO2_01_FULL_50_25]|uniref:Uncharacterized protein n=1 Tax=Candidatus Sungbacteria bacterium RIFCSPHIGHO2_01_FULL_50_25 TaxID=1802265 RepID=A0A1G2KA08_9BACT|nr:MAG: hypothetical protein A2847_00645 [Candidatus Sungbacteria bacterium RIFCSPHIGHO2_01_FULL_50_25]